MKKLVYLSIFFMIFISGCFSILPQSTTSQRITTPSATVQAQTFESAMTDALNWFIENPFSEFTIATFETAIDEMEKKGLHEWQWFISEAIFYRIDPRSNRDITLLVLGDVDSQNTIWLMPLGDYSHNFNWGDKIIVAYMVLKGETARSGTIGQNGGNSDLVFTTFYTDTTMELVTESFIDRPTDQISQQAREAMIVDIMRNHRVDRETATIIVDSLNSLF